MTDAARRILEEYVSDGKLMQVSSVSETGCPALCHVWYHVQFRPDRLYFISRRDRAHSDNIRRDERVAGGIVTIPLIGLGQKVTGVTFKGRASELGVSAQDKLEEFLVRWPHARNSITVNRVARDDTPLRLYEICVDEWVLFDEETFPDSPRRLVCAER
ncbi:MAG TPA: pyridoxamine 5'-phosphate oxidase family protein [Mycobacteriales bacterium]|nr:pyridoxamine 5'-phosphate oxidase family protein [Mycobacteriales bacterium]